MKTTTQRDSLEDFGEGERAFVIETDEDCQVAQDKVDALEAKECDNGECHALKAAIAAWHKRKSC